MVLLMLNVSYWLAEELSDDHWLNVNKDTKTEVLLFRFYGFSVRIADINV
jgi:hypothetical protein